MKTEILLNINNPRRLEKLYRENKSDFKIQFSAVYPQLQENRIADFWNERLNYEGEDFHWGSKTEILFVLFAAFICGCIAKFPAFFALNEDLFVQRNIGFIVLPVMTAYFAWKMKLGIQSVIAIAAIFIASAIYINLLPDPNGSDSVILACIHMPLVLWSMLGYTFTGAGVYGKTKRLEYLRFNGDLAVMMALIGIAGGILSAITIGLFSLIYPGFEKFYGDNFIVFGIATVPMIGTYLARTNPQIVNKVSPVIAKIFSPLVLIMLTIYLVSILVSGKDLYNDRQFLLTFNAMLIGVLAIILFSVAGTAGEKKTSIETMVLFALSVLAIIVNGFALSAILFRLSSLGITPNRVAVLGGNMLILINLVLVSIKLFRSVKGRNDATEAGMTIASYLPVYAVWAMIVTFLFPLVFGFK